MKILSKKLALLLLLVVLLLPRPVGARVDMEKVESFSAEIAILPQGGIEVTETVVLISHGQELPWGIERVLPRWQPGAGGERASEVEVFQVLEDGAPVEYSCSDTPQGVHLVVGNPDVTLPAGRYTYTISYRCSRVVQYGEDSEHLTWNATGYWPVFIEQAQVSLKFSRSPWPEFSQWSASVGADDQTDTGWTSQSSANGVQFESTQPIQAGEAMTISAAWPQEYSFLPPNRGRIINLDCHAMLDSNRGLTVHEEIILDNDGSYDQGFYRDFPTIYRDEDGRTRIVQLDIKEVLVNNQEARWEWDDLPWGRRLVLAGDQLHQGPSTLRLSYTLDRGTEEGMELEEIQWNLPEFSFAHGVEQAVFRLELPPEIPRDQVLLAAYTRWGDEVDSSAFHYIDDANSLVFANTRPLAPEEALVCSAAWSPHYLEPVPWRQRLAWLVRDNIAAAAGMLMLVVLLLYYFLVWLHRGRRPLLKPELRAKPPQLSPAELRFLRRRGAYDNKTFISAVLSLAVKDCLMIVEEEGKHALVNSGLSQGLSTDEETLVNTLFAQRMAISLEKDKSILQAARTAHRRALRLRGKDLFRRNRGWFYLAGVASVVGVALSGLLLPAAPREMGLLAGFALWCALLALVAVRTLDLAPGLVDERGRGVVAMVLGVELVLAVGVSFLWGRMVAQPFGWLTVLAVMLVVAVNVCASRWLPAPTPKGWEGLNQARGFILWLLDDTQSPGGPARFQKYLPYALALDSARRWGRRFGAPRRRGSFSFRWYQGSRWHTINAETLAAALSQLPRSRGNKM